MAQTNTLPSVFNQHQQPDNTMLWTTVQVLVSCTHESTCPPTTRSLVNICQLQQLHGRLNSHEFREPQMHCPCPSLTWPQVQVTHAPHQILSCRVVQMAVNDLRETHTPISDPATRRQITANSAQFTIVGRRASRATHEA